MKTTLSRNAIIALSTALRALDGRKTEVKDGDGRFHVINKPFELPGKTRMAIAKTLRHLRPELEAIDDATRALFKQHAGEKPEITPGTKEHAAFTVEQNALMREEIEVEVNMLPIGDLKIDTNQIDGTVVEGLLPVIDGDI
jgi:hypothetical protein